VNHLISSAALAIVVVSSLGLQNPASRLSTTEQKEAVNQVAEALARGYVLADRAADLGSRLRTVWTDRAPMTAADFATALTRQLQEITGDVHLEVMVAPGQSTSESLPPPSFTEMLAAATRRTDRENGGFNRAERLDGNIGYVKVDSFQSSGLASDAAAAAFTFVARTSALIIDIRDNPGGDPGMVTYLCSYLLGPLPVHVNDVVDRNGKTVRQFWSDPVHTAAAYRGRPVYVLTSSTTVSAAEEFAYNLQASKRARVVGERTAGGAHLTRPVPLSGGLILLLPFARALNPVTGQNWQGTGVSPDIAVTAPQALQTAHKDALDHLIASTADVELRAFFEAARAKLGK
jgi:peptidase S41-like protein